MPWPHRFSHTIVFYQSTATKTARWQEGEKCSIFGRRLRPSLVRPRSTEKSCEKRDLNPSTIALSAPRSRWISSAAIVAVLKRRAEGVWESGEGAWTSSPDYVIYVRGDINYIINRLGQPPFTLQVTITLVRQRSIIPCKKVNCSPVP